MAFFIILFAGFSSELIMTSFKLMFSSIIIYYEKNKNQDSAGGGFGDVSRRAHADANETEHDHRQRETYTAVRLPV